VPGLVGLREPGVVTGGLELYPRNDRLCRVHLFSPCRYRSNQGGCISIVTISLPDPLSDRMQLSLDIRRKCYSSDSQKAGQSRQYR